MKGRTGFTLIELLVVISIIALLSGVVLASLNSARRKAAFAGAESFAGQVFRAIGANAVGIWEFEEQSSTVASDSSGNGNNGAISGSVTYITGPVGPSKAIGLFSDAYVQVPDAASLDVGTSDFTVMAWIRTTGYFSHGSAWNIVVGKGDCCGGAGFAIGYDNTNAPRFMVNSNIMNAGNATIGDDQWHHVAGVRKGTLATVYIDGKEAGSMNIAGIGTAVDNASPFYIGKDSNGVIRAIRGYVDSVVFVPQSLTAKAIEEMYALEAPAHGVAAR